MEQVQVLGEDQVAGDVGEAGEGGGGDEADVVLQRDLGVGHLAVAGLSALGGDAPAAPQVIEGKLRVMDAERQDGYGNLLLGLSDRRTIDEVAFQIAHGGIYARKDLIGQTPMGPSNRPRDPANFFKPKRMTGAQIAEVEVDLALGTTRVLRMTAAHDVGRAINPLLAEGQIEGGIAQGLGLALMEEFLPGLEGQLFMTGLGTMADKSARISALAAKLAAAVAPPSAALTRSAAASSTLDMWFLTSMPSSPQAVKPASSDMKSGSRTRPVWLCSLPQMRMRARLRARSSGPTTSSTSVSV